MFHVLSIIIINIFMMIISFSTDNLLIVSITLLWSLLLLINYKDYKSIKTGFIIMLPIAIFTALINIFIVNAGNIVILTIGTKKITLEIIIYVIVMSIKLLTILYLFYLLGDMLDTDKALSYLSKKSPKLTLILLLCLKLMPNMQKRLKSLKEVYMVRGIDFNSKSKREAIKANVPVLSILLEDSLEKSFDIAESAYVRGFFSGKRTEYERQKFKAKDYLIIIYFIMLLAIHIIFTILKLNYYDIYGSVNILSFFNIYSVIQTILLSLSLVFIIED